MELLSGTVPKTFVDRLGRSGHPDSLYVNRQPVIIVVYTDLYMHAMNIIIPRLPGWPPKDWWEVGVVYTKVNCSE